MAEFLKGGHQVCRRPSPAIQPPDYDHVNLAAPRRFQQLLPQFPLGGSGADLFDLQGDVPAPLGNVFPHGTVLQWQSLLVVRRDTGVEASAHRFCRFRPLAKNPARFRTRKYAVLAHFEGVDPAGRNLSFPARRDSSYPIRERPTISIRNPPRAPAGPASRRNSRASTPTGCGPAPPHVSATRSGSRKDW